jgi:nucleolar protein 56
LDSVFLLETEAGLILVDGGRVVDSVRIGEGGLESAYSEIRERARRRGLASVKVTSGKAAELLRDSGIAVSIAERNEADRLQALKLSLMVEAGFAKDEREAIEIARQRSIAAAEEAIREASSRPDLHLVQAIQALDDTDKFLNVTATRVSEWYGLHFPELTQMMQDNIALCRMVVDFGRRENYTKEGLAGRGLSDKKVEAILTAKERSKGGEISDRDMERLKSLAKLALELSTERDRLSTYVESAMRRIAPNVAQVAGATIGARLMAKAGGLDRLAVLPASTIQILGAEKALFRALRTGARPPKHGILFQHQEVHSAPRWQRGKIARTIANKVAIAARVDYYRGTEEATLKGSLEKRLEQIKEKYREQPRRETGWQRDRKKKKRR